MSKKRSGRRPVPRPQQSSSPRVALVRGADLFSDYVIRHNYHTLDQCPEVQMAIDRIASVISVMPLHLMRNVKNGNERVSNALARKLDVDPWQYGTRQTWMYNIVHNALETGNAFAWPRTEGGLITDIIPLPPGSCTIIDKPNLQGYSVLCGGRVFEPDELLHFVCNPDRTYPYRGNGYTFTLQQAVGFLGDASDTAAGFMQSEYMPSLIVKVDASSEELSNAAGREKVTRQYLQTKNKGEPWIIPTDFMDVKEVKPLTLQDLAISDTVTLNKKTVAAALGVPPYYVGAGQYNEKEHIDFINGKVNEIATMIAQELTKKLLYSPEMFWTFNSRKIYNYDIKTLVDASTALYEHGLITGNTARGWVGLPPEKGLDQLVMLENYIPVEKLGDQKKLKGGNHDDGGEE